MPGGLARGMLALLMTAVSETAKENVSVGPGGMGSRDPPMGVCPRTIVLLSCPPEPGICNTWPVVVSP